MKYRVVVSPMQRYIRIVGVLALVLGLLWTAGAPARADSAPDLSLDSHTQIVALNEDGSGTAVGTFSASGDGASVVCSAGDVVDEFVTASGDAQGPRIVKAAETYTCADGSGSFELEFRGRRTSVDGPILTFTAKVVITGGTGKHADLRAEGTGSTVVNLATGQIDNHYDLNVRVS